MDPALCHFRIRHPDFRPSNIIISPDSKLRIVGLIDWQHTSILPLFLFAGIPDGLQNYDDTGWDFMTRPLPPENFGDLDEIQQNEGMESYRRRLVHYHYLKNTAEYNELHFVALMESVGLFRCRLFSHASEPWGRR